MTRFASVGALCAALATPALAQTPAGPAFQVNTYVTGSQRYVRAAMEADGDFLVVWSSYRQDGSDYGVFAQRYAASGVPRGSEFQLNSHTAGFQGHARLDMGKAGDFVVVWATEDDGSGYGIEGRRFEASGNAVGAEFSVNTFTTGRQDWPDVGRAADGRFVVSWASPSDGSSYGVAARRFDAAGTPLGGEFLVNTYTTALQNAPAVGTEADGDFVIVWTDDSHRNGVRTALFGQRFDASGAPRGADFQIEQDTVSTHLFPSVGISPRGGFVVSYMSFDASTFGVLARRFDGAGDAVGGEFVVNTYTYGGQYGTFEQVAHDARGNFVVTWDGQGDAAGRGIFAQRFSATGARRGAQFRVSPSMVPSDPAIASDAVGNFVVTWEQGDSSAFGVFARRFGGLGPAALAADPTGNGVLEPNETAEVRPSWRNFNGATQTFGGALLEFTGPPGPTYGITDALASYGPVADGVTVPCSDCYAVAITAAMRPSIHWDTSVVETITPDSQGQQKEWVLHVGATFSDVAPSIPFYPFIEALVHYEVTGGCGPGLYCPLIDASRQQAAVYALIEIGRAHV